MSVEQKNPSLRMIRAGSWSAVFIALLAAAHFIAGVLTPARSGPFAKPADVIPYPYTAVSQFIPLDYYWLIPGFLLAPGFVVFMAFIGMYASDEKRILAHIGLSFAAIYATIMMTNYFIQWTVVVPSLQKGEVANLSLFTQYNPQGIFIVLEALGYLVMSTAMIFVAPVFTGGRLESMLRWLFVGSFVSGVAMFVTLPLLGYDIVAFEVSILLTNWIVLMASGTLLSIIFRRASRNRNLS